MSLQTPSGLYTTEEGVLRVINRARQLNGNDVLTRDSFLYEALLELQSLKRITEAQENVFYDKLNIAGGNIRQKNQELQRRVDKYSHYHMNLDNWLGVKAASILAELEEYFVKFSKTYLVQDINNRIQEINWDFSDFGNDTNKIINSIIDTFNLSLGSLNNDGTRSSNTKGSSYFMKSYTRMGEQIKGLSQYILSIKPNLTKNSWQFEISSDIPKPMARKVQNALYKLQGETKSDTSRTIRQAAIDIAIKHLKLDGEMDKYLEYEIKRAAVEKTEGFDAFYDINASPSSVKGFLGEIANNAILGYLIGGPDGTPGTVIPTGAMRNLKNQEIPIDTIIESFKFQVKNYNLRGGVVTFERTNTANYLISQRSGIGADSSLGSILIQLFGTVQFNQPFSFSDDEIGRSLDSFYNDGATRTVEQYATETYSQLVSTALSPEIENLFAAKINKIIGLDSIFSTGAPPFQDEQDYVNTFFKIEKKYVPSSLILESIINNIKTQLGYRTQSFVSFEFKDYYTDRANSLGQLIEEGHRKKQIKGNFKLDVDKYSAAQLIKLHYEVKLNLTKILEGIIKTI